MKLGLENRKKAIWAAVLGGLAILVGAYEFIPMLTGGASTTSVSSLAAPIASRVAPSSSRSASKHGKKVAASPNLDPTLQMSLLEASEKTMYSGSGRNIFVSQAEAPPIPIASAVTDKPKVVAYTPPPVPQAPPIPLKFFGFANQPGEPKKVFLSQGEDVFIAGEGEIVDRRYKVVRISPNSVEMQDVVNSGPPQSIPLTQG
ncbi:MAG TPA: hypothetical protein VI386_07810 [Candidatus Sulfotelmatobacter sp.]